MTETETVLVADVGGTWIRFALARVSPGAAPTLGSQRRLAVQDHASLIVAARCYLQCLDSSQTPPDRAVLAVAGRVDGHRAIMTNHPWNIDAVECSQALAMRQVQLINDFAAQALAVPHLGEGDRVALCGSVSVRLGPPAQTYVILGPGTGLGVSALLSRSGQHFALESEGGHAAFAPKTDRQRAILDVLGARFQRVSYERLLSGAGLSNLHWAVARRAGIADALPIQPEDVTERARAGDPLANEAIELFCEVLGAFAGDLVLTFGGWDGVFLSGGLVPVLLDQLQGEKFRRAFEDKGRFSTQIAHVPVFAVTHPQAGLLGAAASARQPALATVPVGPVRGGSQPDGQPADPDSRLRAT